MELKVWNFNVGAIDFYKSLGMFVQILDLGFAFVSKYIALAIRNDRY